MPTSVNSSPRKKTKRQQSHDRKIRDYTISNQTDLTVHFDTGFINHAVVVGAAFSRERYWQRLGGEYRNANGTTYLLLPESL